jgi:UDP-GlcNAc:undecaprenyl-phosphate GlcNAc-1-phosphate transferase
MQDGIDGLAGGLVLISLIGFFLISVKIENSIGTVIILSLTGALMSFLIYNFPPATIFMGDNGSYFLGFILAFLAINYTNPRNIGTFLGPIIIIGLPVFDAFFAIIRRSLKGVSLFSGDRSHFYDKLIKKGCSIKKTLLLYWVIQLILVVSGIWIYFNV